jgi:biopolymer transport protein ExbD
MSWLETNYLARTKKTVTKQTGLSAAFLAVVTMTLTAPRSTAQAMQKGISVELAPATSAVPVPDADNRDALIITVTESGKVYFGIDPVASDSVAERLKDRQARMQNLYIKADARAPYACVVKVLDAAGAAGVAGVILLTTQSKASQSGALVSPEGIEIELARRSPPAAK